MNTSSSDRKNETSTSQEENDGQEEMLGSEAITFQKLTKSEIEQKKNHLFDVCYEKDWDAFEKFLSDETISKADKKLVLLKSSSFCCRMAIVYGASIPLIQKIIDCLGELFFGESGCTMIGYAVLHSGDVLVCRYASDYTTVSYEVIEFLVSLGGADLVKMQCPFNYCKSYLLHKYLGRDGECPRIISLLLKVGGLDLLELQDDDGVGVLEFTNSTQRGIIIDYLQGLDPNPRVRKHIESLANAGVTAKEFFDWIDNCQFDRVREYLVDEEVSKEAKMKCITVKSVWFDLPFHKFCERHGPVDIAKLFVDIMGTQFLKLKDREGNTCLHHTCSDQSEECIDYDIEELDNEDFERHHDLIEFILSKTGWKFLLETNEDDYSALHEFMGCLRTDLKCVKSVVNLGGQELLEHQGWSGTILHYASSRETIDEEVIKYLVSIGGPLLTEAKDIDGKKAECRWPDELKEYIAFTTKTSSALSDDLQCPICFDTLFDVHILSQCCHRFCKSCITQSYEKRGNTCPVCRAEYSIGDVKKDPLLGKFACVVKEEKDAKEVLQARLSESQKEIGMLREQLQNALKRKHDEL
ncbi:hypothetical protein CTEN210_02852 [Chaetoceros tenuissimus]|uniref:RING-type domain-containing protein n=1 Tax=Chaetoceros tenuissimus TaxID=426638 RepID=A0AAD3CIQ5_9STRA|nr:hypothetical protein CTEN210_02852 [Chaetoceros tenuissimus]